MNNNIVVFNQTPNQHVLFWLRHFVQKRGKSQGVLLNSNVGIDVRIGNSLFHLAPQTKLQKVNLFY